MSAEPRFTFAAASDLGAFCSALVATATAFLVSGWAAEHLTISPLFAYAIGFACVIVAALSVSRFAPCSVRVVVPIAVVAAGVLVAAFVTRGSGWSTALAISIALLSAGSALGAFVGARIEHPGHLLFVAVASSIADAFSVLSPHGPSAAIARSEVALSLVAISWPMLGTRAIEPLLGVGDVVFCGLYIACARKHALGLRRTWLALAAAFGLTMFAVIAFEIAIPALPFLGAAMLAAHPKARRPPLADRRRGLVVLSVMAALFFVLLLRPHD
jgi:hypothetical protein